MPCYTIKSGDTVARVHADEPPSERSQEAIRDVIAAAGRMMRGDAEPRDGRCCSCGYEGEEETPCPGREDGCHCEHWWDGPGDGEATL